MVAKLSQFSLLDLIFDGVAICDEHKKVIYCNPGLAMMAQVGPGRLCRGKLYDFFLFKDPSFCLMPEGRLTQAPMINQELQFKDQQGQENTALVSICYLGEVAWGGKDQWLVYMRDMTLELKLHEKYRKKLEDNKIMIEQLKEARSRLEEYNIKLEDTVQKRTSELREANSFLNAMIEGLGQGLVAFNEKGLCYPLYTKVCEEIFGVSPSGRVLGELMNFKQEGAKQEFSNWLAFLFEGILPFEHAVELAPKNIVDEEVPRYIDLEFHKMEEGQDGKRAFLVATDRTQEWLKQKEIEEKNNLVRAASLMLKDRILYANSLDEMRRLFSSAKENAPKDVSKIKRDIHTLKGLAGMICFAQVSQNLHHLEDQIYAAAMPASEITRQLEKIEALFEEKTHELEELLGGIGQEKEELAELKIGKKNLKDLLLHYISAEDAQRVMDGINQYSLKKDLTQVTSLYAKSLFSIAEKMGKQVHPLKVIDHGIRFYVSDALNSFFYSLIHIFRNCLDHGIESPEKRMEKGKDKKGQISISLEQEGQDLIFQINDDGQGFPHGYDTEQCFTEGKSTRKEVSEFSGRGSGLAAVREAVLQAGGHVLAKNRPGGGAQFIFRIPAPPAP